MLLGTVPWSLLLLALSPAYADEGACHQCCRASGLGECSTELRLYGQESRVSRDSGGWLLRGVWDVSCNGRARFDASAEVYLDHQPTFGELAMPEVDPREVDCFLRSCSMPSGLCLAPPDASGVRVLRDCASAIPADAVLLARPASPALASNPSHVVIGGRAIAVSSAQAAPGAEVTPAMSATLPGRGAAGATPVAAAPTSSAPVAAAPVVTSTVAQPAADPWGAGAWGSDPVPAPAATPRPTPAPAVAAPVAAAPAPVATTPAPAPHTPAAPATTPASGAYGSTSAPRIAPTMGSTSTTPSSAPAAGRGTWIDSYSPSATATPTVSAPATTYTPPVSAPATTYTPPVSAPATTYTPPAAAVVTPPAAVSTPTAAVVAPTAAVVAPTAAVVAPTAPVSTPAAAPVAPKGPAVKPYGQTGVPVSAYGSTAPDPTGPTGEWATASATNDPINQLVAGLPVDPSAGCKPNSEAGATEARNLANTAEDLRIAGKYNDALSRFRAVVQLDRCNAWGWLGLGQTATALKRPDVAVRALRNTVTLIPAHYGAWTELGKAYEVIGDKARALDAYGRALSLREDYPEALAGAKRLKGM